MRRMSTQYSQGLSVPIPSQIWNARFPIRHVNMVLLQDTLADPMDDDAEEEDSM